MNGQLDCLKYAHENGCPWDENTCKRAAINGHLACLTYAHENGCPWDKQECLRLATEYRNIDCIEYINAA